jgi:hypothetical protein
MTVTVANNYNLRKPIQASNKIKSDKSLKPIIRKTKQQIRTKIDEEEDDETMIGLLSINKFIFDFVFSFQLFHHQNQTLQQIFQLLQCLLNYKMFVHL